MFAALLLLSRRRNCHLCAAGAGVASDVAALARECAWKGKLMAGGNDSSDKIDLLIYGPSRPILDNGFSEQFVLHAAETRHDLERLTPATLDENTRRRGDLSHRPCRQDGTGAVSEARNCGELRGRLRPRGFQLMRANTTSSSPIRRTCLTEEVADVAMGLLIATLREFVKADRYLRSGSGPTQNYPLSAGSLRDRKVGIVGMGRIGQAIARRLEASPRSRRLPFTQTGQRCLAQALSRPDRDGKGGGHAGRDRSRRRGNRENDQCRRAEGARSARRRSSMSHAARWSTSRRWSQL